ncbi:protelomerase family protein [Borrelia sp. P9F1]|uniref:protelomerase family protein n=1 Tax=Borrelia sp. P9F1 TaxID=3058374 RepID=UPI0026499F5A|nr:protelomerase family protein [Borrelia sp. P9F1]WKC58558.1 protelomerase family protein [Borrelia sp. P9F1]WKC58650.1 protelomerase family protein [Borrelia sp. P9F1]
MTKNTHSGNVSNLNNFTENLIKEIRSLDAYLHNGIIDAKTYKLKLNGRAKAFLNLLKGNSTYSPHYVKVTITKIRKTIRDFNQEHPILNYFKLSRDEYNQLAQDTLTKTKERNIHKQSFNQTEILTLTKELLLSHRFEFLYLGILLASGRRRLEVIVGSFSDDDQDEYTVLFQGQLKTKDPKRFNTPYPIPLTIPRSLFLNAYNTFTSTALYKDLRERWEDNEFRETEINNMLRNPIAKLFDSKFTTSDFRVIYTAIILKREGYFNDTLGSKEILPRVAEILGHVNDESASQSYRDFKLTRSLVLTDLHLKIAYIKQNRKLEISKKMLAWLCKSSLNPKITNQKKIMRAKTFDSFKESMIVAIDSFNNNGKLFNIKELKYEFRKILAQNGYNVKSNGKMIKEFFDHFTGLDKKGEVKIAGIKNTPSADKDFLKNTLIPEEVDRLNKQLPFKSKDTIGENSAILSFILEKVLLSKAILIDVLEYKNIKEKFPKLTQARYKALFKLLSKEIVLIKYKIKSQSKESL